MPAYFFICARLELFCDFLQFDWLHERAAFHDILARGPKELFFSKQAKERSSLSNLNKSVKSQKKDSNKIKHRK